MKHTPILFSSEMVNAILTATETKTQTRRTKGLEQINKNPNEWNFEGFGHNPDDELDKRLYVYFRKRGTETFTCVRCPFGQAGDVIWVRETFRAIDQDNGNPRYEYKATETINLSDKWKPSIFMPKEACRIFLKIKKIRVERLIDISKSDAIAEGIPQNSALVRLNFFALWKEINGKDSLMSNPWVWVIEFERVEKPENFIDNRK